jgi:integrase
MEGRLRRDKDDMPIPYDPAIDGIVPPEPANNTVGGQIKAWLGTIEKQSEVMGRKDAELNLKKVCLGHFERFLKPETDIKEITSVKWGEFYNHLLGKIGPGFGIVYAEKVLTRSRQFIKHVVAEGLIKEPGTLYSPLYRFTIPKRKIQVFTKEQVHEILYSIPEQYQLHVLLALNCGFTQIDIASLHPSEVDWNKKKPKITRKRTKTKDMSDDVPVVTYVLWPETYELLDRYRKTGDSEHVLLNKLGNPWVYWKNKVKYDSIHTWSSRVLKQLKIERSFKHFRKTGASTMNQHEVYGGLVRLYLGGPPQGMTEIHYAEPPMKMLEKALVWLRDELEIKKAVGDLHVPE